MFFAQLIWAILRIYFSHIADSVRCFLFARDFMNPTDPHESLVLIFVLYMKQILMDNPQIWICKSDSMDSFLVIIEKSNLVNLQIWSFQKSLIHHDALGFESRNLSFSQFDDFTKFSCWDYVIWFKVWVEWSWFKRAFEESGCLIRFRLIKNTILTLDLKAFFNCWFIDCWSLDRKS